MAHGSVPSVGFILWWRAAPRKRNAFFWFALSTWVATYVGLTIALVFHPPWRPLLWAVPLSVLVDLFLVRERLPRWAWPFQPRARTRAR